MQRFLNTIGISLLALCFFISLGRIAMLRFGERTETGDKVVEIRLAHWQLEGGVRASIDAMAKEYMKLHPGVRIRQLPIPERIYQNWLITQLVGGTAPDIIQIGIGMTPERLARFFVPLTDLAQKPNPYNKGTDLEDTYFRDTFVDGMLGGFNNSLLEYYGVPISGYSIRLFVNLSLLEEITGSRDLPSTYEELIALTKKVDDFSQQTGQSIIPISGSRYNSPLLMNTLFISQTQKKMRDLGPPGTLVEVPSRITEALVDGEWGLDSPEVLNGLELMREVATKMQPGFMQVTRDDASFYFVQGRALMIVTGSWDATSISQQASFPFAATRIPLPSKQHPVFGSNVLGAFSEAGGTTGVSLGLTRDSKNPEIAADFLLFLGSRETNQLFTKVSKWVPSVVGVEPDDQAKPFMLQSDGYTPGFQLVKAGNSADTSRLVANNFHHLVGPNGSVEQFVAAIRPNFIPFVLEDLKREERQILQGIQRMDVQFAALAEVSRNNPEAAQAERKYDMITSAMSARDRAAYYHQHLMRKTEKRLNEGSK